ncbi:MAG: response regulator [Selenomonas sp.]|uniref:response regulator n=1 Tax=Selenomonas sp. TaxID=2053611 RepID=UPI0025EFBB53|nr:response regulator [Selenomonas sp.]MCR5757038.1 response regulator [Selenomonas sp.]
MNIMLIDDDTAVRMMLQDIIEDYDLGDVTVSLDSAMDLTAEMLAHQQIDILIIDMLMPGIDGIQAVKRIKDRFSGKIIMLSQVESKDLVGKAYEHGIDYYIMKPLNRNEIIRVLKNVTEHLRLESFAHNLQNSLLSLTPQAEPAPRPRENITTRTENQLKELGILNAPGAQDLLSIIAYIEHNGGEIPALKALFAAVAKQNGAHDPVREAKAMEQRLRRTIFQGHINVASMGVLDYTNPKFEDYAPLYFDYNDIRNTMCLLENSEKPVPSQVHINMKKFIYALYDTVKK